MERMKLEIKRQPSHILLGLLLVALVSYELLTPTALLAAIVILIVASFFVRKIKPQAVYDILRFIEREEDLKYFPGRGLINYLIGTLVVVLLFEKDIVLASIMILAFGDSISRLVGPFGKIKHPFNNKKFLEGIIAGLVAASLGAMLFVRPYEAITASFFAMLLEGFELRLFRFKIDDNLTIPLISAAVIWVVRFLKLLL